MPNELGLDKILDGVKKTDQMIEGIYTSMTAQSPEAKGVLDATINRFKLE